MRPWNWISALVMFVLVGLLAGCASRGRVDQIMAATNEQAKRLSVTESVMLELAKRGSTVIPDTIATVEPGSMVGWAQATRAVRTEDNKPLLDAEGKVQMETVTAIGKCKSDRAFGALTTGVIKLAALGFDLKEGKLIPQSLLEGAVVYVESDKGASTLDAEHAGTYAGAPAAEKKVILEGMAALAKERGVAFATKVDALTKGFASIATVTGEIVGKVLAVHTQPIPTDLVTAGVTKLVNAVVRKEDGTLLDVLAADTPAAPNATTCASCSQQ